MLTLTKYFAKELAGKVNVESKVCFSDAEWACPFSVYY